KTPLFSVAAPKKTPQKKKKKKKTPYKIFTFLGGGAPKLFPPQAPTIILSCLSIANGFRFLFQISLKAC
ncbi:hypothetical protein, partial [Corynebacterium diphtheriae]|uniref:hypothetical protein n=1 Tax=Corynebacterium diphtheriae TaxID=1717 RepID=UPI001C7122C1